jgi:hypothetical protein
MKTHKKVWNLDVVHVFKENLEWRRTFALGPLESCKHVRAFVVANVAVLLLCQPSSSLSNTDTKETQYD